MVGIEDYKITAEQIEGIGVCAAPDKLTGTPDENKRVFDRLVKELVSVRYNELLALLQSPEAAGEIGGAAVGQLPAGNVQGLLQALYDWCTETDGAGRVGVKAIDGVLGQTVQAALEGVQANLNAYIGLLKGLQGAAKVGVSPFPGVASAQLQGALEELQQHINDINAGIIPDFGVNTEKIANGAVTAEKLAQSAVEAAKIAAGAVTGGKLAENAVTVSKLAPDTVKLIDDTSVYAAFSGSHAPGLGEIEIEAGVMPEGNGMVDYAFFSPFSKPPLVMTWYDGGQRPPQNVTPFGFQAPAGYSFVALNFTGRDVPGAMVRKIESKGFASDSWETISRIARAGLAEQYYNIGDEKTLLGSEAFTIVIEDFGHNDLADGSGKSGITFGTKHVMANTRKMNSRAANLNGWEGSEMRHWCNNELLDSLTEIKSYVRKVRRRCGAGNSLDLGIVSEDYIYFFTRGEILGSRGFGETVQQLYRYRSDTSRIKTQRGGTTGYYYWLATPSNDASRFYAVNSDGTEGTLSADSNGSVFFGFDF